MKVKITEVQGLPHTLTQTDKKTFRLFSRQTKEIDEKLVSPEFYAEQKMGNIIIEPIKSATSVETTNKGGKK